MITNLVGYAASAMVLLTFMAKDMRLLRIIGILSNVAFIAYGVLAWLPPVFCLHLLLLPINVLRLRSLLVDEGLPVSRFASTTGVSTSASSIESSTAAPHSDKSLCRQSSSRT
jgi:hypothetical protein